MRAPAHWSFGIFSASIGASFYTANVEFGLNGLTLASLLAATLGSMWPDIDNQHAPVSKIFPFLSKPIRSRFPHRTLMHSLIGIGISTVFFYSLLKLASFCVSYSLGLAPLESHLRLLTLLFGFAALSHAALDCCTRRGVPLLYPLLPTAFGYPTPPQYRLKTGDKRAEIFITAISFGLFLWFAPVTQRGAHISLHNFIGKFGQLTEVYKDAISREAILNFEGYYVNDRTPVSAQGLILDYTASYFVVLMGGRILYVGEQESDIHLLHGTCIFLDTPPREESVVYRNSSLADILNDIDGQSRVSGHLEGSQVFTVNKPYDEHVLLVAGSNIKLNFADKSDIEGLHVTAQIKGPTTSEITLKLKQHQGQLDSALTTRKQVKDLFERDHLLTQIKELRVKIKRLKQKLETNPAQDEGLLFSGRLSFRFLPLTSILPTE